MAKPSSLLDTLFLYGGGGETVFNRPYNPYDLDEKTSGKYSHRDPDGRRYELSNLTNPNPDRPNLTYEFLGHEKSVAMDQTADAGGLRNRDCCAAKPRRYSAHEALSRRAGRAAHRLGLDRHSAD
jgi:hypothetical protein